MEDYKSKSIRNEIIASKLVKVYGKKGTKSKDNKVCQYQLPQVIRKPVQTDDDRKAVASQTEQNALTKTNVVKTESAKDSSGEQPAQTDNDQKAMASQTEQNTVTKTDEIKFEPVKDSSEEQPAQSDDDQKAMASQTEQNTFSKTDEFESVKESSEDQVALANNKTTTALAVGSKSLMLFGEKNAKYIYGGKSAQSYDPSAYPTRSRSMLIPREKKNEYVYDKFIEQILPEKNKSVYGNNKRGEQHAPTDDQKAISSQIKSSIFISADGTKLESGMDSSEEQLENSHKQKKTALATGSHSLMLRGERKAKNIYGEQSAQSYDPSAYPTGSRSMLIPGKKKYEYVCDQFIEQSLHGKKKSVYGNKKRGEKHAPTDDQKAKISQNESNTFASADGTKLESVKDSSEEQQDHSKKQKKTALATGSHSLMLRGERKAKYIYGEQSPQPYDPTAYPTGSRSMLLRGETKNENVCDQYIEQGLPEKVKSVYAKNKHCEQQTLSKTHMENDNQTGTCNLVEKGTLQEESSYEEYSALDVDRISKQVDSQEADEFFPAVGNLQLSPADLNLIENVYAKDGLHRSTSSHTTRW